MTDTQQKILRALTDPRLDPNGPDAAALKDMFSRHEAERQRLEKIDFSDYTSKRERWEKQTTDYEKFVREKPDRDLKQQAERVALERAILDAREAAYKATTPRQQEEAKNRLEILLKEQEARAGKAPSHVSFEGQFLVWDQDSGTYKVKTPDTPLTPEGKPSIKLTESQAKTFDNLQKAEIAHAQYKRIRDADKILAEGLDEELKGRIPFFGNAALSSRYRRARNAALNVVTAHLRETSGAVIAPSEEASHILQMFPRYGDDPATIRQKAQVTEGVVGGMRLKLGNAGALADYAAMQRQKADVEEQAKLRAEMPKNPEVGRVYKSGNQRRYWTGSRWEDD